MSRYDPDNAAPAVVDEEVLERARKLAKARVAFYKHAGAWAIVSLFLLLVDMFSGSGWWFYWPVLGWGVAIAFHAGSVYFDGGYQKRLEEREVERIMRRKSD